MLIEQRLTWVEHVSAYRSHDVDIISFGSESCSIPFLNINKHWETFLSLFNLGIRIKIVTPRISQSELPKVLSLLEKIIALRKPIELVINDWGLMQYCCAHNTFLSLHIGRQLCRSLLDCPWNQEILDNESDEVGNIISLHPFNDMRKIKALHHQGVKGIELNSLSKTPNLQTAIRKYFEIALHSESYLLTCGRTCLSKRIDSEKSCHELCEETFQLEPSGKWLSYFDNREPFNSYEKSLLSGLSISGKKVTLPQKIMIDEMITYGGNVVIATKADTISFLRGQI